MTNDIAAAQLTELTGITNRLVRIGLTHLMCIAPEVDFLPKPGVCHGQVATSLRVALEGLKIATEALRCLADNLPATPVQPANPGRN